ncbi:MAG: lipopolysaccharide biosynthesis protein [Thermoleophilaceae bacterium]|nr:lipopolysaccharide biosynthesis protein [Thermoleophilaceae bacterium]
MSALNEFGSRVGRHAGIYTIGSAIGVALGLVNLIVLTRFLDPSEFGLYALYLTLAALLTLIYGLVWFKGSIRLVFGGDDEDDDEEEAEERDLAGQARAALGTALAVTTVVALVGTAVVALFPGLPGVLIGGAGASAELVLYAAVAGGVGAVWRLAAGVPRRERRSILFVLLQASLPLCTLLVTVPLVALGLGVRGAVIGLAVGTSVAGVIALVAIRDSWSAAIRLSFLPTIIRRGAPYLPLVISFWVIQNAGVFILAQYASTAEVGLFRVASQVAAFGSYGVTAFLRASGPLTREPIHQAARDERGPGRVATLMSSYFVLGTIGVVLFFALASDVLVQVAPRSYAAAAPLVPLIVMSVVLNGWFRVAYRYARLPNKQAIKISLAAVAGVVFLAAAFLLAPRAGAVGVAWSMVIAFAVATAGMIARAQRSPHPIPFAHRRLPAGILLALGCYAVAHLGEQLAGLPAVISGIVGLMAYPALLLVTGVIPRGHIRPLRSISTSAVRGAGTPSAAPRLERLSRREWRVLRLLVRDGLEAAAVAEKTGRSETQTLEDMVAGLREIGDIGKPGPGDARLGAYLIAGGAIADRDQAWKRLAGEGVDPRETDRLSRTLESVRRLTRADWKRPERTAP